MCFALEQCTTCESRLDVLNLVVVGIWLGIGTFAFILLFLFLFHFRVFAVFTIVRAVGLRLIVGVRGTTLPSLSETLFYHTFEYLHFSSNFFYFSPEEIDVAHFLPKRMLVRFSERPQFIK
jgi:hypothetical protein